MNKQTTYKKCPRCTGTGIYADRGVCFSCGGKGSYDADPFIRVFGSSGEFFGVTGPVMANGTQVKCISRAASADAVIADMEGGCTIKSISEEQARKFFKRYGDRTQVEAN
jgi:DnaJ-class molecular chaperone